MIRTLAATLFLVLITDSSADEKRLKEPVVGIATDKADKIETKGGRPTVPVAIADEESLAKHIPDEGTRKRIAKLVDFKEQKLLVFAWQGSGADSLGVAILESFPEQVVFTHKPGRTFDLCPHIKLYAIRSNVTWSAK
ncbi:MAG: hypothetical protein MUF18_06725 [Fimbriiglobus sp.]|jgi:hypothetical protein|nr:hypothetical protein [Fimbriiglobus sp.]